MSDNEKDEHLLSSGVGEAIEIWNKMFVQRGERGKCNWVPVEEGSTTMKCTYCGDYDIGDIDDENYY